MLPNPVTGAGAVLFVLAGARGAKDEIVGPTGCVDGAVVCELGVDQENLGAGVVSMAGFDFCIAGEALRIGLDAPAMAGTPHPPSKGVAALSLVPRTRRSKSTSSFPGVAPLLAPPNDMKSAGPLAVGVASSCNFRVCSSSMRCESPLITDMNI